MTTDSISARGVRPGRPAPALELPVVGGGTFQLADAAPRLFTMLVFNRGLHCPFCRAQLSELNRRFDELAERGIDVVSISGENEQRAGLMREEWKIDKVPLAYGLSEAQMREWGLFVSRGINADEPAVFNEPALFLIRPDGTVYYGSILSMPVGRPRLDDLLGGIDSWVAHGYPARGERYLRSQSAGILAQANPNPTHTQTQTERHDMTTIAAPTNRPPGRIRIETGAKRVRAYLGGEVVADTARPVLVWEVPYYPTYYFPLADVRAQLLETDGGGAHSPSRGDARAFTVKAGSREAPSAPVRYEHSPIEELRDLIRLDWDAMDAWFEEDEQVFTHPRDPYTRVDILPSSRHVR